VSQVFENEAGKRNDHERNDTRGAGRAVAAQAKTSLLRLDALSEGRRIDILKAINEQEVSGAAVARGCNSNADRCHA
jgi:hypothetical protein